MTVVVADGEAKKVACGPCIRGHRSTKCDHLDRVLCVVKKPGRPLGSCPHKSAGCSCIDNCVTYFVPKGATPHSHDGVHKYYPAFRNKDQKASLELFLSSTKKAHKRAASLKTSAKVTPSSPSHQSTNSNTPSIDSAKEKPGPVISTIQSGVETGIRSNLPPSNGSPQVPPNTAPTNFAPIPGLSNAYSLNVNDPASFGSLPPSNNAMFAAFPVQQTNSNQYSTGMTPFELRPAMAYDYLNSSLPTSTTIQPSSSTNNAFAGSGVPNQDSGVEPVPSILDQANHYSTGEASKKACCAPDAASTSIGAHLTPSGHPCKCGNTCDCLGCAEHPENAATLKYVTDIFSDMRDEKTVDADFGRRDSAPVTVMFGGSVQRYGEVPPTNEFGNNGASWAGPDGMSGQQLADPLYSGEQFMGFELDPANLPSPTSYGIESDLNERRQSDPDVASSESILPGGDSAAGLTQFSMHNIMIPGCLETVGACSCTSNCQCAGCLTHGLPDLNEDI